MRRFLPLLFVVLGLLGHAIFQARPAWEKVSAGGGGRDFASYYYAAQVALEGGDPYDTPALSAAAVADHTRRSVHPFFYPPPFLFSVAWVGPVSLQAAYKLWFFVNEALLLLSLAVGIAAFRVPTWAAALLLWTWSPIPDNAWMGQANLLALVPALVGLALADRRPWVGGTLVGLAAMLKMSPALFLGWWLIRGNWRSVLAASSTAVLLSVAALPWVGWDATRRFYLEILPGFSKGDYHGLKVPISLEANHSIPDLYHRLFPGPGAFLSEAAQGASTATLLLCLALWGWRARRAEHPAAILGALTVLMVATPVYTYEHHLVFLVVAVGSAAGLVAEAGKLRWARGERGRVVALWAVLGCAWFFLAWPLPWLRGVQAWLPEGLRPWCRESKTMAEGVLFCLLLALAGRRPAPIRDL